VAGVTGAVRAWMVVRAGTNAWKPLVSSRSGSGCEAQHWQCSCRNSKAAALADVAQLLMTTTVVLMAPEHEGGLHGHAAHTTLYVCTMWQRRLRNRRVSIAHTARTSGLRDGALCVSRLHVQIVMMPSWVGHLSLYTHTHARACIGFVAVCARPQQLAYSRMQGIHNDCYTP
jgi:hypothetical protein